MKIILEKLSKIQATINVIKGQKNTFGNYNYRSCEDILQALQPFCEKLGVVVLLSDEIKELMNGWVYVEATAKILDAESQEEISVKAQAGIQERKGFDLSQTFGASSSYARKYALNGLLKLDDNKDADTDAFNKLINKSENAEKSDFKAEDNKTIKPLTKPLKNAEKMNEGELLVEAHKDLDLELPFEEESKAIENLNALHDKITDLCFNLNKDTFACYTYFCKNFNVKSADELSKDQLETIIATLEKSANKQKAV